MKVKPLSCVQLLTTPWTVAYQAPLSMGFSRQEYWSGLPLSFPSPGDLPDPGIEPRSPALQADALPSEPKPPHNVVEFGSDDDDDEGFLRSSVGKKSACNAGDPGSIPGLGISPGVGIGYLLQYSWCTLVVRW